MNRSLRLPLALVVLAIVLFLCSISLSMMHRPDDQKLIQDALSQSLKDSRDGKPGSALDLLGAGLMLNGQLAPDAIQIGRFIRESKPDITVERPQALITGNEAVIVSPVKLSMGLFGQSVHEDLSEVTLVFRKEEARDYLFIPSTKWRLSEVRVPKGTVDHFEN